MTASCFCIRPTFEFCALDESRTTQSVQEVLGFSNYQIEERFRWLEELGLTPQIVEAMTAASVYVDIMKICVESSYDVSLLTDQRNLTQFTLLSVSPATEIQPAFTQPIDEIVYEACRLAMLVFSIGVVFPIPINNTPLPVLAQKLQAALRRPEASPMYTDMKYRIPLLWILTLGGIAAFDGPAERAFFASALGNLTRRNGLSSWSDVKRGMELMLWYDTACDEAGETFFAEAQSSYVIE